MTKVIVEALELTGQRGIINKGWGGLGYCTYFFSFSDPHTSPYVLSSRNTIYILNLPLLWDLLVILLTLCLSSDGTKGYHLLTG